MNTKLAKVKRVLFRVLPAIALLWVLGCCALFNLMRKPPETFARFMAKLPGPVPFVLFPFETLWLRARAGGLHVGDPAPDFTLTKLDHSVRVQLASFAAQRRPVVLVFGSYT